MEHNRIVNLVSIGGLLLLILMLIFTSPTEIGPFGVLLFFTTVYIVSFGAVTKLIKVFLRLAFKNRNFRNKDYLYAAVLAFMPIMFLMARSFGAVDLWTTALIIIFISLAEFLVAKRV